MSFSAYGTNKRDYGNAFDTTSLTDKSVDGNFKSLKVMDTEVLTNTSVSGKLDSSKISDKTLNGNFATLKVNDAPVITDVSTKLDSSAISNKTLNGNFATLKVNDAPVITDISGKLNTPANIEFAKQTVHTMTSIYPTSSILPQTIGNLTTGFGVPVPDGNYTFSGGNYTYGTTNSISMVAFSGTCTVTSYQYSNLNVTSKGTWVSTITASGGSLVISYVSYGPSGDSPFFMTLTSTTTLAVNGNMSTTGNTTVGGLLTLGTAGLSAGGTTYTAATLKSKLDNAVTDVSTKLDSSAISNKTLNGNFANLKVNDADVITDVSGKLDKIGGTMTGPLTINTPTYTSTPFCNGTSTNTLGTLATAFGTSIPVDTNYNLQIGVFGWQNTTPNSFYSASGTVSVASGAYTNLTITTKGANVISVTVSGSSLILTWNNSGIQTSQHVCFVYLTPLPRSQLLLPGKNDINMGSDQTKETNAGRIGYQMTTTGALDIYGAGTTAGSRGIKLWDNVTTNGTFAPGGLLTLNSAGLSTDGTTYSAATLKSKLDALAPDISGKLDKTGGKLTGNLGIKLPVAQTNPNCSLDVDGAVSVASLKITDKNTTVEDGKIYVLYPTTVGGPGTSVSKEIASCLDGFILKDSGATSGSALPYGDYTVTIRSTTDSGGAWIWDGFVRVALGGGYTNLTQVAKGSKVSSVAITNTNFLTITYTSVANAPATTNYYQVTMTPCMSFQNDGMSRFNEPIGLPSSYIASPYADFGQLGGVQTAYNGSTFITTVGSWVQVPTYVNGTGMNNYLTLPAGTHILTASVRFDAAAALTFVGVAISGNASTRDSEGNIFLPAGNNASQSWSVTRIVTNTTSKNYYLLVLTGGATATVGLNMGILTSVRVG